ncbi:hypothetical protein [Streptomyces sp. NPDC003327]
MNVSLAAAGHLAVTLDLYTALVVGLALTVAVAVYRKTAPAPAAVHPTSPGERLAWAVGAAASIIVIGAFLGEGLRGVERIEEPGTVKPTSTAARAAGQHPGGQEDPSSMSTTRRPPGTGPITNTRTTTTSPRPLPAERTETAEIQDQEQPTRMTHGRRLLGGPGTSA